MLAWSPSVAAVMVATVAAQRTRSEQAREEYSSELAGESGDTAALLHSPHSLTLMRHLEYHKHNKTLQRL